jgi:hypothetical protein
MKLEQEKQKIMMEAAISAPGAEGANNDEDTSEETIL